MQKWTFQQLSGRVLPVCGIFYLILFLGQSGGASRWRVCYKRGLPRLVYIRHPGLDALHMTPTLSLSCKFHPCTSLVIASPEWVLSGHLDSGGLTEPVELPTYRGSMLLGQG